MPRNSGYGQFCPVAKAAEIVATRWTPLVLREMICGSRRFNEIHRGVPLMSRALLSQRLKQLERAGVIERRIPKNAEFGEYRLTPCGEELRPIIVALGVWGQRWVESALDGADWDAGVLMWDIRRRVAPAALPAGRAGGPDGGRIVMQFDYADAPPELRRWWLVIEDGDVDLCQSDPGHEVDLYVLSDVPTMARVWIGRESLRRALETERIVLLGNSALCDTFRRWFRLSLVVEAARPAGLGPSA